jgi:hypothetical protein
MDQYTNVVRIARQPLYQLAGALPRDEQRGRQRHRRRRTQLTPNVHEVVCDEAFDLVSQLTRAFAAAVRASEHSPSL